MGKAGLIHRRRHKSLLGKLAGVARDPFAGHGFKLRRCWLGVFVQAAVAFDLTHLFAHACPKQGMLLGKGDTHAVALSDFAAPGYIARIAGTDAQGRDSQINRHALAPGTRAIAGDAAQADRVQALAGNGGSGALG